MPRLEEIRANLVLHRLHAAGEQGWLVEVAAIEAGLAAEQKLQVMHDVATRHSIVHLGMPDFRTNAGRLIPCPGSS
ncbi:hypothetical protein [Streptomyces sp. NBC_00459]|uniref:hypothetical protein n=1 Tax=Streptomyces sp. NBC_00459 TaxID=2975749 RepID=UPI002E17BBC9